MKIHIALTLILILSNTTAMAGETMQCDIGPLKKEYGGTNWLVYSCTNKKSLVFITDQGNPAMPFYFMYHPKNGVYNLHGEGTGNKKYTNAAYEQLKTLPLKSINELISSTLEVAKKDNK